MKRHIGSLVVFLVSIFAISSGLSPLGGRIPVAAAQVGAIQLQQVITGLDSPLYLTHAGDGSDRLFIVEQGGRIKVAQPGASTTSIFLDITSRVLSGGERGLLGLAFHPQYETNRRFFVNYTRQTDGATVIAEYQASTANPNVADTTERVILVVPQPFANHNGGMIEFGPLDGFLYIGLGDGGSANDPGNRAQNINELLGKMLRINVDGALPYAIPADNPFVGVAGRDEIWALGLRNPFRWSFDRGGSRQLICGDVGQGQIEEIDIITRGANYGWRVFEGTQCTGIDPARCSETGFTGPIEEYNHTGGRCSVTGGYIYRGTSSTFTSGTYLFGDFCSGEIFTLVPGGNMSVLMDTELSISSFGEDQSGEIYVVDLNGTVFKLVRGANAELIVNGGFESGIAPWTFVGRVVRSTGSFPHTGQAYAILGGVNNATGRMFQPITIPSGTSPALSFWLNVTSNDTSTVVRDRLFVEVRNTSGTLLATLATFSNVNRGTAGVYVQRGLFNLGNFAGQTVRIQFRATTNASLTTSFRVDDVSVR